MPNYNSAGVDLAVAALAQIEMHPETWNQQQWRCDTGMCLAGWMGQLSDQVTWENPNDHHNFAVVGRDGAWNTVGDWAAHALGFEDVFAPNADALFHDSNSIEDLRAGVKALCNGESVREAIERDRDERAS
jgi:hypothetical protein